MKTAASIAALAALGLVAVNYSSEGSQLFLSERITEEEMAYMRYVTEWGKSYGTKAEFTFRMEQFKKTMAKIAEHESNDAHKSTVGVNQFSDWTEAEFERLMGFKGYDLQKPGVYGAIHGAEIPAEVDWVKAGAVTGVKNQGSCGSCWSFSATGSMEGANQIETGNLISLSEQQLVDCSGSLLGNHGCLGGLMDNAFKYAMTTPLETEAEYPYKGNNTLEACAYKAGHGVVGVKSLVYIQPLSSADLKAAIAK